MSKTPKKKPDDKKQSQRFIETAKALEVDESGKAFERALKIIKPRVSGSRKPSAGSRS